MKTEESKCFKPGQKVILNLNAVPRIEKDFTVHPLASATLEIQRVVDIENKCSCGCDEGLFVGHLPLCSLTRIKELGCNQLLTVISGAGLIRTHPANWFILQ